MSTGRPTTSSRPRTGQKPPSGVVPQGTATRLTTAAGPGTARPGSRSGMTGGGIALSSQLQVDNRPVTQQGLGGLKTAATRGPQRQVQDKTYFLGLLRTKINELSAEIGHLRTEADNATQDQSSYVSYEKRAESLAQELKELQAELADYNTLVDKMNTDASVTDMQMDVNDMKAQNDREMVGLEALFEQKQQKELAVKQLEQELKQERSVTEHMITDMPANMRQKYASLKEHNEQLLRQLDSAQQELDRLNMKKTELEQDLQLSPVKQEAMRMYEQQRELEEKKEQLLQELQAQGTPEEERDKLLKQVKDDNSEIASIERQINELKERFSNAELELRQLDQDIELNKGERNQQYKELKKREETIDEFINSFENNKEQEMEKIHQLETSIVQVLEQMSRNISQSHPMPTPQELVSMKEDLNFKENEMKKSENTASSLATESLKLHQDLQKVENLESKISQELDMLHSKIEKMSSQLEVYSDLDQLKTDAQEKKQQLGEDKVTLYKQKEVLKKLLQEMTSQYEALKMKLSENETYLQLGNLERKWQLSEQNNFVMKEFVAAKSMECDYKMTEKKVLAMIRDYNKNLTDVLSGKRP